MNEPLLDTVFNVPYTLRRRPVPIPPDLRPDWRIMLVLLMLTKCCRGGRSSYERLHVLSWAIRTEQTRQALYSVMQGHGSPDTVIVRFDPSLNRAIAFAIAENLIERIHGNRLRVTARGSAPAEAIDVPNGPLEEERRFLDALRHSLTEQEVQLLLKWGTNR